MFRPFGFLVCGLALLLVLAAPAGAARAILDPHTLDAYFALYAQDSNVPWRPTSVRLDTYSSAPVDLAVYQANPGDVLTAGSNARPRAIDTRSLTPIANWRFTPPGGYQYQSNAIDVPLGNREGFFVVEARRGNVGEQVWINRTRVGLISTQTPAGLTVYGADLGTGRALAQMRVQFVVGDRFETRFTDAHGVVRWTGRTRPIFALAQWGSSFAFLSFLPQAPLPETIVGVRAGSAVVHAGEELNVVGFARSRERGVLRASRGIAHVSLRNGGSTIAQRSIRLDAAGAFATKFALPENARAGDYALLAQVDGGVGAATVHVDANANGLVLSVSAECGDTCSPSSDVPLVVHARRDGRGVGGVHVRATVVRSPHVGATAHGDDAPWGVSQWVDARAVTDSQGRAVLTIPHPTDGLSSTYGVRVEADGATADTRVVVATAAVALRLTPERDTATLGAPISFVVSAIQVASGKPAANLPVVVRLAHGGSVNEQVLQLNASGRARGTFSSAPLGSSMITAQTTVNGATAIDAAQIAVAPQTQRDSSDDASATVTIATDKAAYVPREAVGVKAGDVGATGDALLQLDASSGTQSVVVPVDGGNAAAALSAVDAPGAQRIGAAFVRDGALEWNATRLNVDAAGRPADLSFALEKTAYAPGETAALRLERAAGDPATVVVRVTRGNPSGSALFDTLPDLLAVDVATTQSSASSDVTWHPWVDSTGDHAHVAEFVRKTAPPQEATLAQAATQELYFDVVRHSGDAFAIPMPRERGTYTLSILAIGDDGRVAATSSSVVVR